MLFVYMLVGLIEYRKYPETWPVYLLLTPLVVTLHAIGAFWGLLRPATDFKITEKTPGRVSIETLEELNPYLDQEAVVPATNSEVTTKSEAD